MAEENQQQAPQQQFAMQRIYLKDLSFEAPMGFKSFQVEWKPKVHQELNTKTNKIDDENYEVILTITINVKVDDDTVYLVEVQQGGVFYVKGLEGQQLAHLLNSFCPQILFPYAREAIDNVITKGSFPALMLPPINFDALFQAALEKAKNEQGGNGEGNA